MKHEEVKCEMCDKAFLINKTMTQGLRLVVNEHLCLQCSKYF